ncbi:MAG TPA: esterase-like activity of phytase family protein, partial [Phycisphaerales bacterium]|nr:esterase-like activity of phytase family protein [Phycisphaerales bacterium]
ELLATIHFPGDSLDVSGLLGTDTAGTPHALLGSFGSGIDFDPVTAEVVAVCDRGPRDGANDFACRVQRFAFRLDEASRTASLTLTSTRFLTSSGGGQFVGSSKAWTPAFRAVVGDGLGESRPRIPARLDPEAIRLSGDTMWIADEYAPALDLFTRSGRHIRREPLPARYACSHASGTAEGELPPANTTGRQPNRGFESLTLSPDGSRAYLMTQSPLIQDGGLDADSKRIGINMRLLQVPLNPASPTREYLYLLDRPSHGVNELLADGESHILVLERDGGKGANAAFRVVYRVELRSDLDIAHVERLPSLGLPPGIVPLRKELYLDLLDPAFGLAGGAMPEKIEGLCWGPELSDGRRTLLVSSDNDLIQDAPTTLWVFAIGDPAAGVAPGTTDR